MLHTTGRVVERPTDRHCDHQTLVNAFHRLLGERTNFVYEQSFRNSCYNRAVDYTVQPQTAGLSLGGVLHDHYLSWFTPSPGYIARQRNEHYVVESRVVVVI